MIMTSGLHIDQAPPLAVPFRFFGTAPVFMLLAGISLLIWRNDLLLTPLVSESVTLVHLMVLGWLSMVMFGAMYQMIPVLAGIRVPRLGWAAWTHALLVIGVISFFLQIGFAVHRWLLLVASIGLMMAVLMFALPMGVALVRAPAKHPTVTAMAMAVASLLAAMSLGLTFLGEYAHGFLEVDRHAMVGMHLTWGLLGWVGTLILGVSFQVLPMFYMMPQFPERPARNILAGLGVTLLALPAVLLLGYEAMAAVTALPGLASIVIYGVTLRRLIRQRKRQVRDTTFRFWQLGLAAGALALLVLALWPWVPDERWRFLFGALFLYGFAGSIVLGMLYKIIPFLVWFHRFSRLVGLADVPMMDDLAPARSMAWHLPVHGSMVGLLAIAALTGQGGWLAGAGVLLMVSAGQLAYLMWFALRPKPPAMPAMPDFNDFFKDLPRPPTSL